MNLPRWHAILAIVVFLAADQTSPGQNAARGPRIGYVYPAGGRQGTSFQITVGGQFLDGAASASVSGTGVQAKVVEHVKPLTPGQANKLREQLKELQQKRSAATGTATPGKESQSSAPAKPAWTAEDQKLLADIRKQLVAFANRTMVPAIAETVTLQVTMAPDAAPGQRELRLGTSAGLTNPLVFCVGQLPEYRASKAAANSPEPAGQAEPKPKAKPAAKAKPAKPASSPRTETSITLPAVANGRIMPGEVDRFRFNAKKGTRLVVAASARQLIPYLADAVPGWFQATLGLYDAAGRELAYADHFRFAPDPVLCCEIPADGQYVIEIKDSIYRGREDFVYRISVGELPLVTDVFPLGGRAGAQTTVDVKGWNLPGDKLTLDLRGKGPGVYPIPLPKEGWGSGSISFAADTLPESPEKEPNDDPARAQSVTVPIIINGRIGRPGDRDVFRFQGQAGDRIVAEVLARRLGSPLDSFLRLTDSAGRELAANDDYEDKGVGLITHHADSWLTATLPAEGTYYLHLSDAQHQGGAEYAYRLRISPPRPDFELRVAPSNINARGGTTVPITVYVIRRDGFSQDIVLALRDGPPGFTLGGGRIPAGQDQVRLTLTVPQAPLTEPLALHLEGRTTIQGREVVRPVVPAEDMMQAFAYRHLVPVKELLVSVTGRAGPRAQVRILSGTPLKIPAGGTARIQVGGPPRGVAGQTQFDLSEPPEGIALERTTATGEGTELVLRCDATKAKPGLKGNLLVTVLARTPAAQAKAKPNQRAVPVTMLPAIPYEIVRPSAPPGKTQGR
jgi:hypothetical protein